MMLEDRQRTKRQLASAAVVVMLMVVAVGAALESPEVEESEAIDPVTAALILLSILGAVGIFASGYLLGSMNSGSGSGDQDRSAEATLVAQSITAGLTYYENALANYDQIWTLTDEHWIRQAELAVAEVWSADSDYDPYTVLSNSGVYLNSGYMMLNAAEQVNKHYDSLSERLEKWGTLDTYSGTMNLNLILGNNTTMGTDSSGDWSLQLGTVVRNAGSGDTVYIVGGQFWASKSTTLTSASGATITVPGSTWTDLDTLSGFESDVWILQEGVTYCGSLLPVFGSNAATVTAGMVADIGGETRVLTYTDSGQVYDGTSNFSSISIQVVPTSGTASDAVNITATLADYSTLLATVYDSMAKASSAASVIWDIYDQAGSTSAYLTTLMVPDIYENVTLSDAQKEIITVLALQQLADWYQDNSGDISSISYTLTAQSMSLYVRGDVTTSAGELYEDVIFTPIFYADTTLTNGTNTTSKYGFIAIWGEGTSLSGWDYSTSATSAELVWVESGATLDIYEMLYDGEIVDTVDLEVSEIDFIEGGEIDPTPIPPTPVNRMIEIVELILTIVGIVMLVGGVMMRSPIAMGIGVLVIILGLFAAEPIADFLDMFGISQWEYT